MFYTISLPLPANTLKTAPVEVEARLTYGIIHQVEIEFPAGCAGLAHVAIDRFEHQVWPTNPDGSFASDDWVVTFDDRFELLDRPYIITLRGWNEDDTYDHTPIVRLGILLPENFPEYRKEAGILVKIAQLLGLGGKGG